jgi:branched-chain amino acid transport system substrate-binding protein
MPVTPWLLRSAASPATLARACLVLCLSLVVGCRATPDDVVFGLAGPFGESYGRSMQEGAELALHEINAGGGIGGRMLRFRTLDDLGGPEGAVAVAEQLYDDASVVAVVGHATSGATIAAASIYGRGLAALATSATSPAISQLGPWIFRVAPSDSANAIALARAASAPGSRIAVLYENDSYGRGLALGFRTAAEARGAAVVESSPYLPTTEDFTPYLERMRAREVETIFIAGLEEGAARIIRQARQIGVETPFVGGDGIEGLSAEGSLFDGTRVGLLYHPTQSARARAFAELFRARYGREPDSFAALAYDAVHLLARAAAGGGRSRTAIRSYLEQVGRTDGAPPFEGVTGTIRFDGNGDPEGKQFTVGTLRGGEIVLEEVR